MTTHEKALQSGLEAYNKFECGSDVDHVRSIVAAYLSALLPEDAAGLVERLKSLVDAQIVDNLEYIRAADEAMSEAATLIQSYAARVAELEAGLETIEARVRPLPDDTPADNKRDKFHAYQIAHSLLNKECKG